MKAVSTAPVASKISDADIVILACQWDGGLWNNDPRFPELQCYETF